MADERQDTLQAYAVCCECHSRTNLLVDESFAYYSLHIKGRVGGQVGISCFPCHDAHGSSQYPYLIKFNEDVVYENALGDLTYKPYGFTAHHGTCSLNYHGVEHVGQEC